MYLQRGPTFFIIALTNPSQEFHSLPLVPIAELGHHQLQI